jgi:hypothetical protein
VFSSASGRYLTLKLRWKESNWRFHAFFPLENTKTASYIMGETALSNSNPPQNNASFIQPDLYP